MSTRNLTDAQISSLLNVYTGSLIGAGLASIPQVGDAVSRLFNDWPRMAETMLEAGADTEQGRASMVARVKGDA